MAAEPIVGAVAVARRGWCHHRSGAVQEMANDFRPSLSDTPRLRPCGQGVAQQFSPETPGDLDGSAWLGDGRSSSVARSSPPLPGRSADLRGSASARHAGAARRRRGWFSSDTAAAEGPMLAMRRSQSSVPGQRRSMAACRLRLARSQRPKCGDVPQYASLLPNSFSFANRAQGHAETRNGALAADRRLGETVATATLAGPVTNLRIEVDRRRLAIASISGAIAWSLSRRRGIHGPAALGSEALNDPGGSDGTLGFPARPRAITQAQPVAPAIWRSRQPRSCRRSPRSQRQERAIKRTPPHSREATVEVV